jgi:hypothetical protein
MLIITDFLQWVQRLLQAAGDGIAIRFHQEPVLTVGVFRAAITVLVGFGLGWSGEQVALMVAFIEAVTGYIARQDVTPNVRVNGG